MSKLNFDIRYRLNLASDAFPFFERLLFYCKEHCYKLLIQLPLSINHSSNVLSSERGLELIYIRWLWTATIEIAPPCSSKLSISHS